MESGAANQRSVSKQSLNCTFTIELSASGDVTMPNKTSLMANRPQIRQWANFPTETEFIQIENRVRQPASCTGCRTLFFVFFSVFSLNLEKCWKLESKKKKLGSATRNGAKLPNPIHCRYFPNRVRQPAPPRVAEPYSQPQSNRIRPNW